MINKEEILKKAKSEADKIAKKNIDKINKEKLILQKKQSKN
mgnify:CR=1 FL=1